MIEVIQTPLNKSVGLFAERLQIELLLVKAIATSRLRPVSRMSLHLYSSTLRRFESCADTEHIESAAPPTARRMLVLMLAPLKNKNSHLHAKSPAV